MPNYIRDNGHFVLNGTYHYWGENPNVEGTQGADVLEVDSGVVHYWGNPLGVAKLHGGNDVIFGLEGIVEAGEGDDQFYNSGVDRKKSDLFSISYGQGGNDYFLDSAGSTKYFGGSGEDYFTNFNYGTSVNLNDPGFFDHDIADLGVGNDVAYWHFSTYSGPEGEFLEPRVAEISGGSGTDTLGLNMSNLLVSVWDEATIDFREMDTGSITIGNATFSDFEKFEMYFGSTTLRRVDLGRKDDRIEWFEAGQEYDDIPRLDYAPLKIFGRGGDDFIVGSTTRAKEVIFGGNGNDTITGASGIGTEEGVIASEVLRGGKGDDVLYYSGVANLPMPLLKMVGGKGADRFVIGPNRGEKSIKIKDFEVGVDEIVLDFTGCYSLYEDNNGSADPDWINFETVQDSNRKLVFEFAANNSPYNVYPSDYVVTYRKKTGAIFINSQSSYPFEGDGERIARLKGAPELSIDDFVYFDWDTF